MIPPFILLKDECGAPKGRHRDIEQTVIFGARYIKKIREEEGVLCGGNMVDKLRYKVIELIRVTLILLVECLDSNNKCVSSFPCNLVADPIQSEN